MPDIQHPIDAPLPLEPDISWLRLDDRSIGEHFGAWFVTFVLSKWGIDLSEECLRKPWEQVLADHSVLIHDIPSAAFDLVQDDVEGVLLQEAAKFWAKGEPVRAGTLIRGFIEEQDEALTGRRRQRRYAKNSRGDALSKLIYEVLEERNGNLTEPELLRQLHSFQGMGVIEEISDEYVFFIKRDGTGGHRAKITNLRGRLSTARSKFRNNNPSR